MTPHQLSIRDWRELNKYCGVNEVILFQIFVGSPSVDFRQELVTYSAKHKGFKYVEFEYDAAQKLFTRYDKPAKFPVVGAWTGGNITNLASTSDKIPELVDGALRFQKSFAAAKQMREEEERGKS